MDNSGMVTLLRNGVQNMRLSLEKGKRHLCHYETEFGELIIGACAHDIKCNFNEHVCSITLEYTLDINTKHLSENKVIINVKEMNINNV